MVPIGNRPDPVAHHEVLRPLRAHDFVLCLGYKADVIKEFFLTYNEALANDFVLSRRRQRGPAPQAPTSTTGTSRSSTRACTQHRPAPARGARAPRGRRDVPRQLRRRAHRRAAADDDRDFDAQRQVGRASCACGRTTLPLVDVDDGRLVRGIERRDAARTCGSTAASSSSAARSSTISQPGEELVEEPFERLIGREASCSPSGTTASGRRWTR